MPGKTARRTSSYQSSNTSTMLYDRLQRLREQIKDIKHDIENVQNTIDLAREDQKKYLRNYHGDNWSKSIKRQMAAATKKNELEMKIDEIKKDMVSVRSLMKKGGRFKRKSKKKRLSRRR